MVRLAMILHLFIGATLSGVAVIAVLVAGLTTLTPILAAAAAGFVAAFPVSYLVARQLWQA